MPVFMFAWTDIATGITPTFDSSYEREDEEIVSFKVEQQEGDCATLSIDIRNPKIGLLAPGRPLWAWLSYDSGSGGIVPLFFGRLVGVPTNILAEVVTLQFTAKPLDFNTQKFDLAQTLMVLPWYDPIFIDPKLRPRIDSSGQQAGDPDVVLEAYSALWHVDRLTLQMTTSDILLGEDGLEVFSDAEVPYDSVSIELGQAPLTSVHVSESVDWSQAATGQIDFGYRYFQCPTGGSIVSSWPKTGAQLAGGWSVVEGYANDTLNIGGQQTFNKHYSFENRAKSHEVGDVMSVNLSYTEFPVGGQLFVSNVFKTSGSVPAAGIVSYSGGIDTVSTDEFGNTNYSATSGTAFDPYGSIDSQTNWGDDSAKVAIPMHVSYNQVLIPNWLVNTKLVLGYNAGGKRNETADFTLIADLQSIVTLPDPTDVVETLELNGTDVGLPIDGSIPIVDGTRNAYFPTDRGQLSLEYGILRARAHMLMRARAVNLSWNVPFERAIQLTCRKNAQLTDNRIPGGVAQGKIIAYSFGVDGDAGMMIGNVTIGCAIGHAGTVTESAGDPDYVTAGYVQTGYQTYSGAVWATAAGDVGYSIPVMGPGPLITTLTKEQVTVSEDVLFPDSSTGHDGYTDWVQVGTDTDKKGNTVKTFAKFPIMAYRLELLPVDSMAFDNLYDVSVTMLNVPKGIDLEAATTL